MLKIADSCPGDNGTVAKGHDTQELTTGVPLTPGRRSQAPRQRTYHPDKHDPGPSEAPSEADAAPVLLKPKAEKAKPKATKAKLKLFPRASEAIESKLEAEAKPKATRPKPTEAAKPKSTLAGAGDLQAVSRPKPKAKKSKAKVAPKQRPAVDSEAIPFVFVPLWLITSMGASTAVVLLARMIYWLTLIDKGRRTRLTPMPKDRRSWGPGHKAIIQQTGLTGRQVDGALKILTRRKRIEGSQCAVPGSNHRLIRFTKGFHQWLCKEPSHLDDRSKWSGVKVRVTEIVATDNIPQALLLAVILNRFERNAQGKSQITVWDDDGQGWRYNTRSQLAKETGLSQTQVKRALRGLREKELIRTTIRLVRTPGKGRLGILHVQPGPTALAKAHKERSHG